jgi:hypothetical protein
MKPGYRGYCVPFVRGWRQIGGVVVGWLECRPAIYFVYVVASILVSFFPLLLAAATFGVWSGYQCDAAGLCLLGWIAWASGVVLRKFCCGWSNVFNFIVISGHCGVCVCVYICVCGGLLLLLYLRVRRCDFSFRVLVVVILSCYLVY